MYSRLMALTVAVILLLIPLQRSLAIQSLNTPTTHPSDLDLPEALAEDDSFGDLPFEQLRQALREEVERGPKTSLPHYNSTKRYNLFIR